MSSAAGLDAIMSAMRWSNARVGHEGLRFLMRQRIDQPRFSLGSLGGGADSSEAAGAASSSRRQSAPS